ncbi:hypothetical protein FOCC_FOCC016756 [Frankliniella occidentalis]|nr:hypothetical protein FOCC_FOCC016756 [Frankliniella occidentalis]
MISRVRESQWHATLLEVNRTAFPCNLKQVWEESYCNVSCVYTMQVFWYMKSSIVCITDSSGGSGQLGLDAGDHVLAERDSLEGVGGGHFGGARADLLLEGADESHGLGGVADGVLDEDDGLVGGGQGVGGVAESLHGAGLGGALPVGGDSGGGDVGGALGHLDDVVEELGALGDLLGDAAGGVLDDLGSQVGDAVDGALADVDTGGRGLVDDLGDVGVPGAGGVLYPSLGEVRDGADGVLDVVLDLVNGVVDEGLGAGDGLEQFLGAELAQGGLDALQVDGAAGGGADHALGVGGQAGEGALGVGDDALGVGHGVLGGALGGGGGGLGGVGGGADGVVSRAGDGAGCVAHQVAQTGELGLGIVALEKKWPLQCLHTTSTQNDLGSFMKPN